MSDITILTYILTAVRSDVGVVNYPGWSTIFPPAVNLIQCVSVFWCPILYNACTYDAFLSLGVYSCKINFVVSVPACDFNPCEMWPRLLHIDFSHTGASFLIGSLYPKTFPVVSQWVWFSARSTIIVSVSGSTCISWSYRWRTVFSFFLSVVKSVG